MADLGRKHVCFKCSAKFYDLKRPRAACPKCGADQADAPVVVAPPPPPPTPARRAPRAVDPVEEEAEVAVVDDEAVAGEVDDDELDDLDEAEVGFADVEEPGGEDTYD